MDAERPAKLIPHVFNCPSLHLYFRAQQTAGRKYSVSNNLEQYRVSNAHRNDFSIPLGDLPGSAALALISTMLPLLHRPDIDQNIHRFSVLVNSKTRFYRITSQLSKSGSRRNNINVLWLPQLRILHLVCERPVRAHETRAKPYVV